MIYLSDRITKVKYNNKDTPSQAKQMIIALLKTVYLYLHLHTNIPVYTVCGTFCHELWKSLNYKI